MKIELDQLKSKIQTLESHVSKSSQEVKKKDEIIAEKEKIIQDRMNSIETLQNEIASLEKNGVLNAEEQAYKLKGDQEKQNMEKVALETRVTKAEEKIHDLNSKLEDVVESPNSNSNSRNAKAFSPFKKFLMQSYYDRHTNLHDSDFENFMSQEVPFGFCEVLPNNHNFLLRPSVLKRNLIGGSSHPSVSTLIKFPTQQSKSLSELLSYSCEFIIIERLSSGVFADPFELQRLVQRGVFNDIAVFGDTNLELPSFLSNRSAVEIHLDVDPNILLEPSDIKIELPLHARYQPLNESGYCTVEFGAPDMLVRCSTKENVENRNCFFKLKIDDANLYDADIVWSIPSGRKAHAEIVSGVTFIAVLLSTLVIVVT
ncbi:uncharacterized protein LOC133283666 [Gastrolobium bilobum]|uniref:uncharacterized protein LOC133283666 n=1 Tax=Gastrolobium bilobum TaxID=150636 RepID=UPI002AAF7098|nr:uncharacterized protein LOC133283666 [Gastrolobium bilobum]